MTVVTSSEKYRTRFQTWLVSTEANEAHEWRGYCPIHEEPGASGTPSASFNFLEGKFMCFSGCGGMSLGKLAKIIASDGAETGASITNLSDAPSKRSEKRTELPDEEKIKGFVDALLNSNVAFKIMKDKRGFTKETIERFQIGYDGERFTIPVRDAEGHLVNVRRYNPIAKNPKDKMRSWGVGMGSAELFYPAFLNETDEVIITEGETDCILGQQVGLPTVTHTGGALTFRNEWAAAFEDKTVFICYDVDSSGQQGSMKAAAALRRFARAVYIIRLPLQEKGADLTDYLVNEGHSAEDFRELMNAIRENPYSIRKQDRVNVQAREVTLEASMSAEYTNRPLSMTVSVAGKVQPAYVLPKKVLLSCDGQAGNMCNSCPMMASGLRSERKFAEDDTTLIEMVDSNSEKINGIVKKAEGIPTRCTRVEIDTAESWNVEELVVVPSVDVRGEETQSPISRRVYNVGQYATPVNITTEVVGLNISDPKNGRAVFQSWKCEPVQTNLDNFEVTSEVIARLSAFRPAEGQSPIEKMREIADDLTANVTRIYGREELHMFYDVIWHSIMDFRFNGVKLGKGWLEGIVIGDTRTGKSEVGGRLCDHYNSGVLKSCEGATFAGLVGGAQQMGSSWMVTWGTIPLNDRRLVILDEVSGIKDKGIIDQMSAVRSSGKAQITKIVGQETSARTRLVWISNPPEGNTLEEMPGGGIDGLKDLIKNPEDISRFDLAMSAASSDVSSDVINSREHEVVTHFYDSELCSELVAWAWSRKADDVEWGKGVEDYVLDSAKKFGAGYVPEPPLIQSENVRIKLARISVAIAARLFSTSPDGRKVSVGRQHVDAAMELLDLLYGMRSFGYKHHSRKMIRDREISEENTKRARKYLLNHEDELNTLLQCRSGDFKVRDFCEFAGMSQDEAQIAVKYLMELKMIRRMGRGYIRANPVLIALLNKLEDEIE